MSVSTITHEDYGAWQRKEHRREMAVAVLLKLIECDAAGDGAPLYSERRCKLRADYAVQQASALIDALAGDYKP